jgi:polyisoprenoid-binding protein YceI
MAEFGRASADQQEAIRGEYVAIGQSPGVIGGDQLQPVETATTIDRRDWGIDWQMPLPDGSDAVGWEVELSANLELIGEA